ncbi:hypothetical protein AB0J83_41125 [Actinoplanes sp. NPDC049596]|uniref:hypothetical protein n=1 Tax=unclassified Actinoplanes TaxID=2626549 RepID=UPI003434D4A5
MTFDAALWRRQDMLSDLREWIEARPGLGTSGYITDINDPEAGSTVLVWHAPPDHVQRQMLEGSPSSATTSGPRPRASPPRTPPSPRL